MAKSKKIVFHSNQLGLRGTEIALYDYAHYNEIILKNTSIVVYDGRSEKNDDGAIEKFNKRFQTFDYCDFAEVDRIIAREHADLLYKITNGLPDEKMSLVVPTMIHAVFPRKEIDIHGSAYAYVSDWLSDTYSDGKIPAVPHIVELPERYKTLGKDLRSDLGIPADATVFGFYGGADTFKTQFVKKDVIPKVLNKRADIYFLFMNITPFIEHERVIFLPGSTDLDRKVKFINSTDAMLHARKIGESFGMACAEFSILNKPIIADSRARFRSHLEILRDNIFLYSSPASLMKILMNFDRESTGGRSWDFYTERFSPQNVMQKFDEFLIKPALSNGVVNNPGINFSMINKINIWLKKIKIKLNYYVRF